MADSRRVRVVATGKPEEDLSSDIDRETERVAKTRKGASAILTVVGVVFFALLRLGGDSARGVLSISILLIVIVTVLLVCVLVPWSFDEPTKSRQLSRIKWVGIWKRRLLIASALVCVGATIALAVSIVVQG